MKRADDLASRIETIFAKLPGETLPRFQFVTGPGEVIVHETEKKGYARIACRFGEGVRAIQWSITAGDLRPIGSEKNADGAVLLVRPDGALEAHVMECKQTIDSSTWKKALSQLEWTVIKLLAIAGALHERVERVVLYTAFRSNALAPDESADASLFELPLGVEDSLASKREFPMRTSADETEVDLPGWASPFLLVKVRKDEHGHASVDLRVLV
ncbi:hypothetical protein [Polyangium aurulentum]|uniref:hypothetical protein n=1 Tax=Polyangium aurulentum TaxID=2567896 RepID=UPI0010ADD481|nr:hypothetical protein [Polyangium aurulentum]UQA56476.1 hypothetical protein E8A73_034950 [Polyangium aurulentum]